MKRLFILIGLLILTGCTTPQISRVSYPNTPTKIEVSASSSKSAFEAWLLTYTSPMQGQKLTSIDADRCIQALRTGSSQDVKDAAIWQLSFYDDWSANQLKTLAGNIRYLDEDNQWDVMSLMETMFTDDFNAPTAEAFCRGWIGLMAGMRNKDDASTAADNACYFAHPVLMNHALARFNGNVDPDYEINGVAPYFAYNYYDSLVSDYVDEDPSKSLKRRWSQWWHKKENQLMWLHENCDYVAAPRKYMRGGDIHAYIFTVSNYPDCWGNIDLPGTAKDAKRVAETFLGFPNIKTVRVYQDQMATYDNYKKVWQEIASFDSNEIFFIYFSGHGATDSKGKLFYLLLYDFGIDYVKGEFTNTPSGTEIQDSMYGAKYMHNNKLVFLITDSCLAGGLARSQSTGLEKRIKSFRPLLWGETPIMPDVYYDLANKNLGNYILSCRENQYSYDTPDGGAFTINFFDLWKDKKFKVPFENMLKLTGKQLLRDGFGMTPTMVCPKGNEKLTIYK